VQGGERSIPAQTKIPALTAMPFGNRLRKDALRESHNRQEQNEDLAKSAGLPDNTPSSMEGLTKSAFGMASPCTFKFDEAEGELRLEQEKDGGLAPVPAQGGWELAMRVYGNIRKDSYTGRFLPHEHLTFRRQRLKLDV
jgi:hypothetical protein